MKKTTISPLLMCLFAFFLPAPAQQRIVDTGEVGKYELNIFGGGTFFRRQTQSPNIKFEDGGTVGIRFTQNYWRYIGIEEAFRIHGTNNPIYTNPATGGTSSFGARNRGFTIAPIFHFTPREERFRPFLKAGLGLNWFGPTDDARAQLSAVNNAFGQPINLDSHLSPLFMYGAGIKYKVTDRVGFRVDADGTVARTPSFGIPATGPANSILVGNRPVLNGSSITGGVTVYMGAIYGPALGDFTVGQMEASTTSAFEGDPLNFKVPASTTIDGVKPKWSWFFANQPAPGGMNSEAYSTKAPKPGDYEVKAIVEGDETGVTTRRVRNFLRKNPITSTERKVTVNVKPWPAPTLSGNANPSSFTAPTPAAGTTPGSPISVAGVGTSTVTASSGAFERPRDLTYTFTASEGRLTPGNTGGGTATQPNPQTVVIALKDVKAGEAPNVTAIYTPEGVTVPAGGSKTIDITAKVVDSHGPEASETIRITLSVPQPPAPPPPPPPSLQPLQLDDLIFGHGRARVNNCDKRVLDSAYERLVSNGDYDLVLVGHIDEREARIRQRRGAKTLEQQRVLNAAAYLTAGVQPCKNLDASRIKVMYAGTDQTNESKALLCATSTTERAADRIRRNDDRAKNRRVEVWLVPRPGKGPMPAGLNLQDLSPADLPKGCPQ
jgi:outer membrane protein OmpA-like peptidoglycan-associated protein